MELAWGRGFSGTGCRTLSSVWAAAPGCCTQCPTFPDLVREIPARATVTSNTGFIQTIWLASSSLGNYEGSRRKSRRRKSWLPQLGSLAGGAQWGAHHVQVCLVDRAA